MRNRARRIALFLAVVLPLAMAATAAGYTGQVAASVTVAGGEGPCGEPIAVTATVLDGDGQPVAGQSVDWTLVLTLDPGDRINETPTVTNSNGVARTTVTLACVNGSRTVRATAGAVSGTAVLNVEVHGLPNTSTQLGWIAAGSDALLAVLLLAAIGCAVGGALTRRRLA